MPGPIIITDATPQREAWTAQERKVFQRFTKLMVDHQLDCPTTVCLRCREVVDAYDRPNEYELVCRCTRRVLPK